MKRHHILTILLLSVALGFFIVGVLASTMMVNTATVNTTDIDSKIVEYVNTEDFCTTFPELDLASSDDYEDEKLFLTDTYVNNCLTTSLLDEDSEINDESLTEISNVISNKGSTSSSSTNKTINCGTMDVLPTDSKGITGTRDNRITIRDFSFLAQNMGKQCDPTDEAYLSTQHCGPMDANKDYVLDYNDFKIFSEFFGMKCDKFIEQPCASIDTNNDGNITVRDFTSSFAGGFPYKCKDVVAGTPVSAPKTNTCDVTADSNGDGYVTRTDYNYFVKNLNKGCPVPSSSTSNTTNR